MRVQRHIEIESTQKHSLKRVNEIEEIEVVVAERQTKGIGRGGNNWISCSESLTFSLSIRGVHLKDGSLLSVQCIKEVLENNGVEGLRIKWPNDLYIDIPAGDTKKICGVLVNIVESTRGVVSIIGVGLNIGGDTSYTTLKEVGYTLNKEKVFLEIVESITKSFKSKRDKNRWNECFPYNYLFLNKEKYFISEITDSLLLTKEEGTPQSTQIHPEDYSYDSKSNSLKKKTN